MRTLVISSSLALIAACDPVAQPLCEAKVACGLFSDTYDCFDDLQATRDKAASGGCVDQYYALIECESGIESSCDGFDTAVSTQCSQEQCEYNGCFAVGGTRWPDMKEFVCGGGGFNATGRWDYYVTPATTGCFSMESGYFFAIKSGSTYKLVLEGLNPKITGTVMTSPEGATAHVMLGTSGDDGNGSTFSQMADLTITATPQAMPGTTTADLTGSGTYTLNGCTDSVTLMGEIRFDERAVP